MKATIVWVRTTPGQPPDLGRHDVGQLLVAGHPHDRDEVPLAGHRVGLGHAVDVRQRPSEGGQRVALGLDQHDGVRHPLEL